MTAESPLTDWAGVVGFAKDNPGKLRWGTAGVRGVAHLAVEAAFRKEGIKATFVPFGGGSEAITALLGNHIEAVVSSDYGPHLAAKRVRLRAFTGTGKLAGHERLPAFRDLDYPLATEALYGLFGPAKLPKEVVTYWEAVNQRDDRLGHLQGRLGYGQCEPDLSLQCRIHRECHRELQEARGADRRARLEDQGIAMIGPLALACCALSGVGP